MQQLDWSLKSIRSILSDSPTTSQCLAALKTATTRPYLYGKPKCNRPLDLFVNLTTDSPSRFDAIDVRTLSTFDYYPPAKGKTHTSTEPSYQLGNTDHNVNKRFIPYELPQVAIPPQLKETHISPAPKQSSGGSKAPEKRAVVASANNSSPYYRSKLPTQVKPIGKDTIIPRLPGISNATMIPKKVKGACAACKKRKISCGVPSMPGSNACNQCWKLGVECDYYNPKN